MNFQLGQVATQIVCFFLFKVTYIQPAGGVAVGAVIAVWAVAVGAGRVAQLAGEVRNKFILAV